MGLGEKIRWGYRVVVFSARLLLRVLHYLQIGVCVCGCPSLSLSVATLFLSFLVFVLAFLIPHASLQTIVI